MSANGVPAPEVWVVAHRGARRVRPENTLAAFDEAIHQGCDAIEPFGLFAAAVMASPVGMRVRLVGLGAGAVLFFLVNEVRIVTLYFTGTTFPEIFEVMHLEVWQALFILFGVTTWVAWAGWSVAREAEHA